MAVAHDAVSESHTGTAGVANVTSFTWNHVPTGSPRSALVFTEAIGANPVTGVTYGGVAMTAVPYTAADTDTEPGSVQAWFLDNCGTGTKAVVVSRTSNAVVTYATCMTQTAAKKCQVYLAGVKTRAGSAAEQTAASSSSTGVSSSFTGFALTDGSPGTNSIRYMAVHSGAASVPTASTNTTTNGTSASIDFGAYVFFTMRETTPSQGSKTLTITTAISDDLAAIGLAIREDPNARDASIVNTGGGVAAVAAQKGGQTAAVDTGGGVAAIAAATQRKASVTATGGGVAVVDGAKAIDNRNASVTATGGGVAAVATRKGGQTAAVATGGGVVAVSRVAGRSSSAVATGGGVAAVSARTQRSGSVTATGGGVAAVAPLSARSSSEALTGGGVVVVSRSPGRSSSAVATGGGVAVVGRLAGRQSAVTATGGGVVVVDGEKGVIDNRDASIVSTGGGVAVLETSGAHTKDVTATGAGVAVVTSSSGRIRAITATGGGVAVVDGARGVDNRDASIAATGGGAVSLSVAAARQLAALLATGGGLATLDATTGRAAAIAATGGGVVVIDGGKIVATNIDAIMRLTDAGAGEADIIRAPSAIVTSVTDAPVILSARLIP